MTEQASAKTPRGALIAASALMVAVAIGAGGYWFGANRTPIMSAAQTGDGREVLYWYDPMAPEQHFDAPGRSPFMDMDLVPRYADEGSAEAGVRVDAGVAQNLGVRLADVESASIARTVTGAGVVAFSERSVAIVQARASGFVERSHGRAVGDVVAAGAPIVDIRVPEWAAAQAEYLALRSAGGELAAAARQRLVMLGMSESLIARVERDGAPLPIATVTAPIAGAITALDIRGGMIVTQGAPLATINGVSPVWLIVSLPQANADVARPGGRVSARVPAYPGETFAGRIESVLPAANAATRSVEVRIALPNSGGHLRPGMTAEVELTESVAAAAGLLVPSEAIIRTGRRTIVVVALDNGRYVPTEVELGRRSGDRIEIRSGLTEGQRVVASGQFLIDSEASLSGALARLDASSASRGANAEHDATGRITQLDGVNLSIAHSPVPSLQWPSMTMTFVLERAELAQGLAVGDTVAFRFRQEGSRYIVSEIRESGERP